MRSILEWWRSVLPSELRFLAPSDYVATLAILVSMVLLLLFAIGLARLLLGSTGYRTAKDVFQESLLIVTIGVILSSTVAVVSSVFPQTWLKSFAESIHEGLVFLVLIGILAKGLSRTCNQFEICRLISDHLAEKIRKLI